MNQPQPPPQAPLQQARPRVVQHHRAGGGLETMLWHFFMFFVIPCLLIVHFYVFSENLNVVTKYVTFGVQFNVSVAWLMFQCIVYGVFISATLFYFVYLSLLADRDAAYDACRHAQQLYGQLEQKHNTLKVAANQIMVPYNLDKLADKNLLEFSAENYRPGNLHASAKVFAPPN